MHVEIPVSAPPAVPAAVPTALASRLIPFLTLVVTAGMVAAVFATRSSLVTNPMFLMFPAVLVVSALSSLAQTVGRQGAAELNAARRRYLAYLHDIGVQLAETAVTQRNIAEMEHPEPDQLWQLAETSRRWERDPGHPSFCRIRVGRGQVPATNRPVAPEQAEAGEVDPVTTEALQRLLAVHTVLEDAPVTVDLRQTPWLRIGGDEADARALARAMVCQLATFHSPAHVSIVAVTGDRQRRHWDWLKWLPHQADPMMADALGPRRLTFGSVSAALAAAPADRTTVLVIDGVDAWDCIGGPRVSAICIAGGSTELDLSTTQPDALSPLSAATCARRLTAHRDTLATRDRKDWFGLLDGSGSRLRIPLGTTGDGEPLHLDINEAALGGAGPHGLCLGATGSGKSELLRTVALGMIARHSPEDLNLVLVDFKGGATFLDLERAPHVSAVITNLADEAYLVDRMQDALGGEMHRRQQLLRFAGNLTGVAAYAQARRFRPDLPALPALFVIVDEFSELLSSHPEFIEQFVAIGRLGRSLGIHLLLASQRLDEGRLRGLDSHLSYRICLKTLSPNESRVAIGVPDAHHLPTTPGAAYLKVGADNPVRFQVAHVSGPAPLSRTPVAAPLHAPAVFSCSPVGPVRAAAGALSQDTDRRILDLVLDAAADSGPAAHQVWLPPLLQSPTLDSLAAEPGPPLAFTIGIADRAFEQRYAPVVLDLSGAAGNVAVVGAPQSGKSTALRTLALALAARHHPADVQLYCLDFGGGGLSALAELPHIGAVAGRQQPDLVHRTVAHVAAVVRRREALFGADYRRQRAAGPADDPHGDVFLMIDGWATLRQEFDGLDSTIAAIAAEGLSFGVHVVLSASRWADIRPALKDQIGTRIELRLGDPVDSEIDRARARSVPVDRPGSGLAPDGAPMLVALPRLDGVPSSAGLTEQVTAAAATLRAQHHGLRAPQVRLLPDRLDHHRMPKPSQPVLGVGGDECEVMTMDFEQYPLLLVSGDAGCGKTAALRLLYREICRTTTSSKAQVYLIDPRRTLLAEHQPDRVAAYAATAAQCSEAVDKLVGVLRGRMPGADVTAQQLRARSWWTGPEVYLIVDDHDLVAGGGTNPLSPVLDLLAHASDIGLHLVVAQRENARSLYEPLPAAMRDLAAATLQMGHSEDAVTRRPRPLRPGRAVMTTRSGRHLLQIAWVEPA
jgi:S-DNA-T family DNA segregation ATPase FtsK/SpoIIIE